MTLSRLPISEQSYKTERISTTLDNQLMLKLDIRWGYNNVQIKESDQWKATFVTNRGLFEPNVMFFGLRNSPATFQAMMDDYFRDLTDKGHVIIYMDDILIHAVTTQRRLRCVQPPRCVLREFGSTWGCSHNLGRTHWGERRLYLN